MRLDRREALSGAHESSVWSLAWTPDHGFLTGSLDESVILWHHDPSLVKSHTFLAHGLGAVCLAVHGGGQWAASSCLDGCIRAWDLQNPSAAVHRFQASASENWGMDFAPVSERVILAVAGGATSSVSIYTLGDEAQHQMTLQLPNVREGQQRHQRSSFVLATKFSPDGHRVTGTCNNGLVVMFDAETGKELYTLTDNVTPVRAAVFSPVVAVDSEMLVTGSDAAQLMLYDIRSGNVIATIDGRSVKEASPHEDPSMILDLSFHPDGSFLASSTGDGKVHLWDLTTKEQRQTIDDHKDAVWCAQFSPDGTKLATACDDGSLGLFTAVAT